MAINANGIFQVRNATNSTLASVVLLDGEIGYATDINIMKVGDGTNTWNGLSDINYYSNITCGMIYEAIQRSYTVSTGVNLIFTSSTNITGTTVGTNSLVIQSAGTYKVVCNLSASFPATTTNYIFSVTKNGNKIPGIIYDTASISTGRYLSISMGGLVTLASTDIIEILLEGSVPTDSVAVRHVNLYLKRIN